jgi:hypothetical protein
VFKKKKILDIEAVYALNAFRNESGFYIAAGSETGPEVYLYDMESCERNPIPHLPGGMMSFVPIPGKQDLFASIMEMFPPFKGKDAGIYLHTRMGTNWESGKALSLPFAYRCETLETGGRQYLVAATVSRDRDEEGEWSQPGELHVIDLELCEIRRWKSTVVESSIFRNHCMVRSRVEGKEVIYVSGQQGIFCLDRDGDNWKLNQVFYGEVSEMAFIDLDGDGKEELVTLEPFHGDSLNVYKRDGANWEKRFSDSLSSGQGLSAGLFNSEPLIVAGNRGGSRALEAFYVRDLIRGRAEREIIDESAGPARTQVFTFNSRDFILSANQIKNEVALYS